jgi:hypothetical protein
MKARKIQSRAARAPMFSRSGIGSAVAMVLIASGAQAATTSVDTLLQGAVAGVSAGIPDQQTNSNDVGATVNGAVVGTTSIGTSATPTPMSQITGGNLIGASATGNSASSAIGSLPGPLNPVNDAATLAVGINTGVVSSSVENSAMNASSNTFQTGSIGDTNNTISAATTLNSGVSSVSGTASGSAAATPGSAVLTYPAGPAVYDAAGNLVVTSVQAASGQSSQALVQGNQVGLVLTSSTNSAVLGSGAATLGGNTVSAVFKGNTANSTVNVQASGAPTFAGSAVVANLQANGNGVVAASHTATNAGTTVYGVVQGAAPGVVNALQGTLNMQGNTISSAATGNEALGTPSGAAGNSIVIDGLSVAGAPAPTPTANDSTHAGVGVVTNVKSDLAVVNSQGNLGAGAGNQNLALTSGAAVLAGVQKLDGGTVALRDNAITAGASGNVASSAIAASNAAATFSATSALSNQQANNNASQTAVVGSSLVWANAGDASNGTKGTVDVSNNRVAATAQGSQVTQSLSIGGGDVDLGGGAVALTGGTSSDGRVFAMGGATITNLQGNYNGSGVGALNGAPLLTPGSQIWLTATGAGASLDKTTLSATANRQEAIAVGNGATNALALEGTTVGTGAGIASVQMGDGTSSVGAGLLNPQVAIEVTGDIGAKSAVALTDNVQRAVGYGNSVANTASVKATDVSVAADPSVASTVAIGAGALPFSNALATQPAVNAAYGVLNDQSVRATVNSAATSADSYAVGVVGSVADSSVANDRNAFAAGAFGNDAQNGVSLTATNIVAPGFASVANVTNTQAVGGNGTAISATAAGGTLERTVVTGNLDRGNVSSSSNSAQALAFGNRATGNSVSVKATNIDTRGAVNSGANLSPGLVLTTNASFSVQNAQSGQGSVRAERSGGPEVATQIGGDVRTAGVKADGNEAHADATSNSATNGVAIDAANVATTSAVQNAQITTASVDARLGSQAGVQVSVGGAVIQDAALTVDGNKQGSSATGNDSTNSIAVKGTSSIDAANGQLTAGANVQLGTSAGANADHALSNTQLVGGTQLIRATADGAFGIATAPGVAVGRSQLSVSGNEQQAQATGNTAGNSVALSGTNVSARSATQSTQQSFGRVESKSTLQVSAPASVSGGSAVTLANNLGSATSVINDATNTTTVKADNSAGSVLPAIVLQLQSPLPAVSTALADQVIVNRQSAFGSASATASTTIRNTDGADPLAAGLASGGSFQVTGNKTLAAAAANQASNAVALSGSASQAARLAVLNVQDGSATVSAKADSTSELTLLGASAFNGASASLSGNSTGASAIGNAATNSLEVKGGAIEGNTLLPIGGALTAGNIAAVALGDQVLVNSQTQGGAGVTASATGSTGIHASAGATVDTATLGVSGNRQSATAVANTAVNTLSLTGSNVAARSVLQSVQVGDAPVTASSTSALFAPAGSSASGVSLSGNGNTALGVINDATNTLTVSATNALPVGAIGSATAVELLVPGLVVAVGDHVVSNRQAASTAVQAAAATTLSNDDTGAGAAGVSNGAFTISGNSTYAEASANRAINTAAVAAGATQGASVAVVNSQSSTAAATATASTIATVGLTTGLPLNSGSIALDGNTTVALARGNAATNTLDASAGAGYGAAVAAGPGAGSLSTTPLALNVGASAAILNSQTNSGAVLASSTGTGYQVALNSTAATAVSGGTVGVTGNTLAAQAFGNSATNRVTQTALNSGAASAVVGNYQVNTGAVTASVTSVNFGAGVSGAVGNGSLRTTGNQITASATGNSATSSILAR